MNSLAMRLFMGLLLLLLLCSVDTACSTLTRCVMAPPLDRRCGPLSTVVVKAVVRLGRLVCRVVVVMILFMNGNWCRNVLRGVKVVIRLVLWLAVVVRPVVRISDRVRLFGVRKSVRCASVWLSSLLRVVICNGWGSFVGSVIIRVFFTIRVVCENVSQVGVFIRV